MSASRSRPTLAVFDFDGTLTDRHTFWRYMRFVNGAPRFWLSLAGLLPEIVGVLLGTTPLMQARRSLIRCHFRGLASDRERAHARVFVNEQLPAWLRPAALRRLRWHQAKGHTTLLISNAPENYLRPWANTVGFDHVCGTRLAGGPHTLSGDIEGHNCVDGEKVARLRACVGDLADYDIYAYGDSSGDAALLAIATFPFYRNWY
ncbi:HAD family hydrolase [Pseudomonas aeruginosa]